MISNPDLAAAVRKAKAIHAEVGRESVRMAEDVKAEAPRPLMRELPPADPFRWMH